MTTQLDPRFPKTEFAIEANSFETHALWSMYAKDSKRRLSDRIEGLDWKQDSGILITIGYIGLGRRPVTLSCMWNTINGHLVVFYNGSSMIVDHEMIENWFKADCDVPRFDANNFPYGKLVN